MFTKSAPILLSLLLLFGAAAHSVAHAEGRELGLKTVVIDPGHGGKDPGCVSRDRKTYEKTLVLKISQQFAERLRTEYPDLKVILTRDKDEYITLSERARIASRANANLFISIHINAASSGQTANGFSAFILGPSTKYDSFGINMDVCKRENSVIYLEDDYSTKYRDFDSDSPESQILLQLMMNAFREQSISFAEGVSSRMTSGPFRYNMGVLQGNLAVLREASMPAVLLEFGFISNPGDLGTLRTDEGIRRIVDNLIAAFRDYKTSYDQSVAIPSAADPAPQVPVVSPQQDTPASVTSPSQDTPAPAVQPSDSSSIVGPTVTASGNTVPSDSSSVWYGTQVLAGARLLFKTDPFFHGYELKTVRSGSIYKYILGWSSDLSEAKRLYSEIGPHFEGSFMVKVVDGTVSAY